MSLRSLSRLVAPATLALLAAAPLAAQEPESYPEGIGPNETVTATPRGQRHMESASSALALSFAPSDPLGGFVHTTSATGTLAVLADEDDFESGALGPQWATASSTANGRIQVTDGFGAASGTFALLMDTTVNGPNNLNEAVWTVDLTGRTEARLVFAHADFNDEETAFSGPFTGSYDADGVAISADGTNWFPVFDAPSQSSGVWQFYVIDLGAAAANAGISLGADFRIKFQQYDNFALSTDGRGYDAISIEVPGIDVDAFELDLDPGQQVTVAVTPDAAVQPIVELMRGDVVLGTAAAAAPGEPAVLRSVDGGGSLISVGSKPRRLTLVVTNAIPTSGSYDLDVMLNTDVEMEALSGGPNGTLVEAQDLGDAFLAINRAGTASGEGPQPDRAAVLGALGATVGDGDDFESGALGPQWSTYSSDPQGRIRVTDERGAAGGTFALLMDRDPSGSNTLNEAIWTVDLTGLDDVYLAFAHAEWGDETHNFSGPFVGHFNADGVAISADGTNWYPVFDPPNQASGTWERYQVDIGAAAANAGIALGPNFQIKFQQYDNFPIPTDGRGWDDIAVQTAEQDVYHLTMRARETMTVVATALSGSGVSIDVLDSAGNVVAPGTGSAVVNGGFESGDFAGWRTVTTGVPFRPWGIGEAGRGGEFGLETTDPALGSRTAWCGFDGVGPMSLALYQDVTVPAGAPVLRWRDRLQWTFKYGGVATQPRRFDVEVRDPATGVTLTTLRSFLTGTSHTVGAFGDTGWQVHEADLSAFAGQPVRLYFRASVPEILTGPGQLELDGIEFTSMSNVDAVVRNFAAPVTDDYYIRVSGLGADYALVATRNADFDIEDNDTIATAGTVGSRRSAARQWLIGHVDDGTSDGSDFYRVGMVEGATLVAETDLPGDDEYSFLNDLDPMLRLYDANGNLVASDDNSAPGGRNARIEYVVPMGAGGDYFVEVTSSTAAPSAGVYVLTLKGNR